MTQILSRFWFCFAHPCNYHLCLFLKVAARRASFAERQSAQLRCLDELFLDLCNSTALRLERVLFLPFGDIFHPPIVQQSFNILQEQSQFGTSILSAIWKTHVMKIFSFDFELFKFKFHTSLISTTLFTWQRVMRIFKLPILLPIPIIPNEDHPFRHKHSQWHGFDGDE